MKKIIFILSITFSFFITSCNENVPIVPIVPQIVKSDSIPIKKDTLVNKKDTIKLKIDTTKFNFVLFRIQFRFIPNQNTWTCASGIWLDIQNNVTQDSINRFCNNYCPKNSKGEPYYKGNNYYKGTIISKNASGDIVFDAYESKIIPIKLPKDSIPLYNMYHINYTSVINTEPSIYWLNSNCSGLCPFVKLTKNSLDFVSKYINKDTVIKLDTVVLSLKIKYTSNILVK